MKWRCFTVSHREQCLPVTCCLPCSCRPCSESFWRMWSCVIFSFLFKIKMVEPVFCCGESCLRKRVPSTIPSKSAWQQKELVGLRLGVLVLCARCSCGAWDKGTVVSVQSDHNCSFQTGVNGFIWFRITFWLSVSEWVSASVTQLDKSKGNNRTKLDFCL